MVRLEMIFRGQKHGNDTPAATMAVISSTWFDYPWDAYRSVPLVAGADPYAAAASGVEFTVINTGAIRVYGIFGGNGFPYTRMAFASHRRQEH